MGKQETGRFYGARTGNDLHFKTEIQGFHLEVMESWRPASKSRIEFIFEKENSLQCLGLGLRRKWSLDRKQGHSDYERPG